ncbi:DNA helicase UvrD [archaeon CG10_big_fil_rev_8_21_14_0_10_43_11]|nr:MAG: DNA helicase UvrD [archaeon CG10_big_fil_rev_8_21_14_0_10_43_11]
MRIFADLHNHSKYSRATSKDMDLEHQTHYGVIKGLTLLGSGDATHPVWLQELKNKLEDHGTGIYTFKNMHWILSSEVSNIYATPQGTKKIHHILLFPNFDVVDQVNELLSTKGNLAADGRPIFGRYPASDLVYDLKAISQDIEIIPAHVWTPWFSLFGSRSGYNSIDACYEKQAKHIYCLETGLSSDPGMNWSVSKTHGKTLVSNSDSHSPHPWRIGRECNVFSLTEFTYANVINTLRQNHLDYTVEVAPDYGKYHYDGHRACNVRMHPAEAKKHHNMCPQCGQPLVIGVLNRVLELTDTPPQNKPASARPFKTLLPLAEIIRVKNRVSSLNSKKVLRQYYDAVSHFKNEFDILIDATPKDLEEKLGKQLASMILALRNNTVSYTPGYDGVYGEPIFSALAEPEKKEKNLCDFF